MSRITLWGFHQYDPTLFDNIDLPEAMDKETLINEIMMLSGDLYPYHQVPARLKQNLEFWFLRRKYNFAKMFEALNADYNPIENYDRYESSTEATSNSQKTGGSDSHTSNSSANGTSDTRSDSSASSTDTGKVSAYDTLEFSNLNQNVNSDSSNVNMHSSSGDSSQSNSTNSYGRTEDESGSRDYSSRVHGNIGVTTAQQMITAELELRRYDLYKEIALMFEHDLLIQVY